MIVEIVIGLILMGITWKLQGFCFASVMILVTTVLFAGRKVGYFVQVKTIVMMEFVSMLVTYALRALAHNMDIMQLVLIIGLRLLFVGMMYWDNKFYVYITEEVRKDEDR